MNIFFSLQRAESIRNLLHFADVKFEDKIYMGMEEWGKDKEALGLDFPNVRC